MAEYIPPEDRYEGTNNVLVALCSQLAPISSIAMFLSPIPTIRIILKTGTVGDLPLLPYTSMVTSCFVWIVYGILKGEPLIYATNIVEFTLSVYYFVEFTNYAPSKSPTFPGSVYNHIRFTFGIWGLALFAALFFSNRVVLLGNLTVALTILTLASPLAAVKAVLESQSSESIPWPFTLAALFNCVLWTVVGIFELHDAYVYFPEVLGLVFGAVQVMLKLKYHQHASVAPATSRPYVEMPYPWLENLRQVVLLGSSSNNNNTAYSAVLPGEDYDLALLDEGLAPSQATEYVEFNTDDSSQPQPTTLFDDSQAGGGLVVPPPAVSLTDVVRSRSGNLSNTTTTTTGHGHSA